ncbi:hypothetical protein H8356DRAFT_1349957 [Neocallimastix lanati (nom. inval.)]|nr:hypothetical protein H8356DRAFT_1349957 [Neocallimastix sp. JGI-2020a]
MNNNNRSQKVDNVKKQLDEVAQVMQNNVNKLAERGEKVNSLQLKSEEINELSKNFKRNANEFQVLIRMSVNNSKTKDEK